MLKKIQDFSPAVQNAMNEDLFSCDLVNDAIRLMKNFKKIEILYVLQLRQRAAPPWKSRQTFTGRFQFFE